MTAALTPTPESPALRKTAPWFDPTGTILRKLAHIIEKVKANTGAELTAKTAAFLGAAESAFDDGAFNSHMDVLLKLCAGLEQLAYEAYAHPESFNAPKDSPAHQEPIVSRARVEILWSTALCTQGEIPAAKMRERNASRYLAKVTTGGIIPEAVTARLEKLNTILAEYAAGNESARELPVHRAVIELLKLGE